MCCMTSLPGACFTDQNSVLRVHAACSKPRPSAEPTTDASSADASARSSAQPASSQQQQSAPVAAAKLPGATDDKLFTLGKLLTCDLDKLIGKPLHVCACGLRMHQPHSASLHCLACRLCTHNMLMSIRGTCTTRGLKDYTCLQMICHQKMEAALLQ